LPCPVAGDGQDPHHCEQQQGRGSARGGEKENQRNEQQTVSHSIEPKVRARAMLKLLRKGHSPQQFLNWDRSSLSRWLPNGIMTGPIAG